MFGFFLPTSLWLYGVTRAQWQWDNHRWPSTQPGSLHTALQRKYTQPCSLFSPGTAVWTMGARLCEQWGTAVCKCPLCRGSPVIMWLSRKIASISLRTGAPVSSSILQSLWPSYVIWWHVTGSTLVQVMACYLMAPSHYLNQCRLISSKVPRQSPDGDFIRCASSITLKIIHLKFHWNLPAVNELTNSHHISSWPPLPPSPCLQNLEKKYNESTSTVKPVI